jgi:putative hydrolase of the HAD superfamily
MAIAPFVCVEGWLHLIRAILFDLGDTLITEESVGDKHTPNAKLEKVPFVDEVLQELKRKYKLAVVTNTSVSKENDIKKALQTIGLAGYFDAIVTSVDVGHEKPDERIFRVALKRLRVKPAETVMVGNRIKTDILGANKVGIKTIHFKWNDRYPEKIESSLEKPGYTIRSIKELLDVLPSLERELTAGKK